MPSHFTHTNILNWDKICAMYKTIAFTSLAALMGVHAFVSPTVTIFPGSPVAQRVSMIGQFNYSTPLTTPGVTC